jgi:hypothetical protein
MAVEARQCRFCLESGGRLQDPLIRPCACRGSVEWVHRLCLQRWALLDPGRNSVTCTICHQRFTVRVLPPALEPLPLPHTWEFYILDNYLILVLIVQYLFLAFHLPATYIAAEENIYRALAYGHTLLHAVYVTLMHRNVSVRQQNRGLYEQLLWRSRVPVLFAAHMMMLLNFLFRRDLLMGMCVNLFFRSYWRDHLGLLRELNRQLLQAE